MTEHEKIAAPQELNDDGTAHKPVRRETDAAVTANRASLKARVNNLAVLPGSGRVVVSDVDGTLVARYRSVGEAQIALETAGVDLSRFKAGWNPGAAVKAPPVAGKPRK